MNKQDQENILSPNAIISQEYDIQAVVNYWKENKHAYVCSSKVGSSVIRHVCRRRLDIPYIYLKQNWLRANKEESKEDPTESSLEDEMKLKTRKMFFLVRCPFHRVISSYSFLKHPVFNECKKVYLSEGINLDAMNIIEYVTFLDSEIKKEKYNKVIEHFYPQKQSFLIGAFKDTKINLLWQTEKINELLEIWNKAFNIKFDTNRKIRVSIKDQSEYYRYYYEYPELFDLVKKVFKEDLDWLNPFFNYERNFKKKIGECSPNKKLYKIKYKDKTLIIRSEGAEGFSKQLYNYFGTDILKHNVRKDIIEDVLIVRLGGELWPAKIVQALRSGNSGKTHLKIVLEKVNIYKKNNNKKKILILDQSSEAIRWPGIILKLIDFFKKEYGFKKVIFLTMNRVYETDKFYLENPKYESLRGNIGIYNVWLDKTRYYLEDSANKFKGKKSTFLLFTGMLREYRKLVLLKLLKNGWLDKDGIFSWSCPDLKKNDQNIDEVLKKCFDSNLVEDYFERLSNLTPKTLDMNLDEDFKNDKYTGIRKVPQYLYDQTHVSLVLESDFFYPNRRVTQSISFTEKTIKCFLTKQPFIIFGNVHTLKTLHELGFKTFSNLVDESYDETENPKERADAIFKQVENIIKLPERELQIKIDGLKDVLEHNSKLLSSGEIQKKMIQNILDDIVSEKINIEAERNFSFLRSFFTKIKSFKK